MKNIENPSREGRWVMIALAALFLSGLVVSYGLVETRVRMGATRNYGDLVDPARPINDVLLKDLDGAPTRFSTLKGKWTLIYFGSAECLKPCVADLYKMRQMTAAQGPDAARVQRVFVVTDATALDLLRYTLVEYPGTKVLRGTPDAVRELATQFMLPDGSALQGSNRIYVVDPRGNFMMSYPADADPSRMHKDLRQLLRASRIG